METTTEVLATTATSEGTPPPLETPPPPPLATSGDRGKGGDHGGRGGTKKAKEKATETTEAVETLATVVRMRRMYIRGPLGLYPYGSRQNFPITREKRGRILVKCQRLSRHEFPQKSGEGYGQTARGRIPQKMQPIGTAAGARCTGQSCA